MVNWRRIDARELNTGIDWWAGQCMLGLGVTHVVLGWEVKGEVTLGWGGQSNVEACLCRNMHMHTSHVWVPAPVKRSVSQVCTLEGAGGAVDREQRGDRRCAHRQFRRQRSQWRCAHRQW